MTDHVFPVIYPIATGHNIARLRKQRGLSVKDLHRWFGFTEPRAIYKWQSGETLPSVDNLYALGALLNVPMEQILIPVSRPIQQYEQQADSCCSLFSECFRYDRNMIRFSHFSFLHSY